MDFWGKAATKYAAQGVQINVRNMTDFVRVQMDTGQKTVQNDAVMDVHQTTAPRSMDLAGHAKRDAGAVRVIRHAYQTAHHVIQVTRASLVWIDTRETHALLVTSTVCTRVIKTQVIARVSVDITATGRKKVIA